jgi:hypothetical protein
MSLHRKSITDLRSGSDKRCSGSEAQRWAFARFSVAFDFRFLQQYRSFASLWTCGAHFPRTRTFLNAVACLNSSMQWHVSKVPIRVTSRCGKRRSLFDHLVGERQ